MTPKGELLRKSKLRLGGPHEESLEEEMQIRLFVNTFPQTQERRKPRLHMIYWFFLNTLRKDHFGTTISWSIVVNPPTAST